MKKIIDNIDDEEDFTEENDESKTLETLSGEIFIFLIDKKLILI